MKNSRGRDTWSSRRSSQLPSSFAAAGENLTEQDRPVLAMQGNSETESQSKAQWTDEKHSLYLKSIEASFVNQLNNSDQFKVLRGGRWQRINFEGSGDPEFSRMNECHNFVSNPWIRRFRPARNHQNSASTSQDIESVENSALSCSLTTSSNQQHCQSPMRDEFELCSNAEDELKDAHPLESEFCNVLSAIFSHFCPADKVSDQNFVDEDDGDGDGDGETEVGIGKRTGNTKKMRTSMHNMNHKEQIMPLRRSPTVMQDSTKKVLGC